MAADLHSQRTEVDVTMTCTVSTDASPPFPVLGMVKSFMISGTTDLHSARRIQAADTTAGQYQTIPLNVSMQRYMLSGAICTSCFAR